MRKVVKVNGRNIYVYRKGHENKHLGRAFVKYLKEGKVALPPNGKHRLQEDRHGKKRVFANSALDRGSFLIRNWVYNGASIGRTM